MAKKTQDQIHKIKNNVADIKFYGNEPTWESSVIIDETRSHLLGHGLNWYHYMTDAKDYRPFFSDWIKRFRSKTAEKDLKTLSTVSDRDLSPTRASLARMAVMEFPLTDEDHNKIWQSIYQHRKITVPKPKVDVKNPAVGPDPSAEWLAEFRFELDDALLDLLYKAQPSTALAFSQRYKANSKCVDDAVLHAKEKQATYERVSTLRTNKPNNDNDQQLLEAYASVTPKNLKATIKWLGELQTCYAQQKTQQKAIRIRKKKPLDKSKMVRKLLYLEKFPDWKLESVKPELCLSANEIWIYNVQTRKLGVYRSEYPNGLSVKGTTIVGANESQCIQKTLRKPQEQVSQFMGLGRQRLAKWFDGVGTTPHALKARTNSNTLILKVF